MRERHDRKYMCVRRFNNIGKRETNGKRTQRKLYEIIDIRQFAKGIKEYQPWRNCLAGNEAILPFSFFFVW